MIITQLKTGPDFDQTWVTIVIPTRHAEVEGGGGGGGGGCLRFMPCLRPVASLRVACSLLWHDWPHVNSLGMIFQWETIYR